MMSNETTVEVCGIDLTVEYESERVEREPYSWGESRGYDTEIDIISVKINDVDICPLLSEDAIERITDLLV